MDVLILIGLIFLVSIVNSTMVPIHARSGQILGIGWATTLYLLSGTIVSILLMLLRRDTGLAAGFGSLPFYVFLNGFYNVIVLACMITLVPKVGVGTAWAVGVMGQFTTALLFDHFGLLGLKVAPANLQKVAGVLLIITGSVVFSRRRRNFLTSQEGGSTKQEWPLWAGIALGFFIGSSQTMMSAINARSGQMIGITGAVTLYLGLGALLALVFCLVHRPEGALRTLQMPPYFYLPGILNVLMVGLPAMLIPRVGVGIYTASSFLAHSMASMLFDSFGILGMPKIPVSATRIAGAGIMLIGVLLLRLAQTG